MTTLKSADTLAAETIERLFGGPETFPRTVGYWELHRALATTLYAATHPEPEDA